MLMAQLHRCGPKDAIALLVPPATPVKPSHPEDLSKQYRSTYQLKEQTQSSYFKLGLRHRSVDTMILLVAKNTTLNQNQCKAQSKSSKQGIPSTASKIFCTSSYLGREGRCSSCQDIAHLGMGEIRIRAEHQSHDPGHIGGSHGSSRTTPITTTGLSRDDAIARG